MTHAEKIAAAMLVHIERARRTGDYAEALADLAEVAAQVPVDMLLNCPACHTQHVDMPKPCGAANCETGCAMPGLGDCLAWLNPPHRSHLCHHCGHIWRPSDVPTNGVASIQTRGKNDT